MATKKNIVIVGGGITGLTAAYYLQTSIAKANLPYEVKLVEATDRLGGKVWTLRRDGFIIERGADSFLARKKPAVKLIEALGLMDELVRNDTGQAYVLVKNKLHKIPSGSFMGIPTTARPFLFTGMFSPVGKLRAGLDYVLPRGKAKADQSLGYFFRRRFGDELVENLIEPLLSGIYSGDLDEMSMKATFPNFLELEQKHRSLMIGLQKTMPKSKRSTGKKPGQFFAFKNGFSTLVEALEQEIGQTTIMRNHAVDHIEKKDHGYHVLLDSGDVLKADAVVMATPHTVLSKVFSKFPIFDTLQQVPVGSVANVAMGFDSKSLKKLPDGTGFVVSRNSKVQITACTWTHRKWPQAVPTGKAMLRCYVGRPDNPEVVNLSDEEIIALVRKDLQKVMKIKQAPEFAVVTRWRNKMPQYTVGHVERLQAVREQMPAGLPGVFLAGSSYEGVGVPDCIDQGEQAVEQVLAFLKEE